MKHRITDRAIVDHVRRMSHARGCTQYTPNQQLKNSKIKDVDVSTLNFYSSVLAVGSFFLRLEFSQTRRWAVLAVLMSIHTHHL